MSKRVPSFYLDQMKRYVHCFIVVDGIKRNRILPYDEVSGFTIAKLDKMIESLNHAQFDTREFEYIEPTEVWKNEVVPYEPKATQEAA
jgi:hypothetical protein